MDCGFLLWHKAGKVSFAKPQCIDCEEDYVSQSQWHVLGQNSSQQNLCDSTIGTSPGSPGALTAQNGDSQWMNVSEMNSTHTIQYNSTPGHC